MAVGYSLLVRIRPFLAEFLVFSKLQRNLQSEVSNFSGKIENLLRVMPL